MHTSEDSDAPDADYTRDDLAGPRRRRRRLHYLPKSMNIPDETMLGNIYKRRVDAWELYLNLRAGELGKDGEGPDL